MNRWVRTYVSLTKKIFRILFNVYCLQNSEVSHKYCVLKSMNDIYVKGIYGEMLRYLLNIFIGFKDIHECKINLVSYESYI